MWIHTVNGFVSIVKHNKIPNCLLVRGRVKADLEAILGPDYEITTEPGSDYTYRAIVDAEDVAVIIADAILDIDYTSHFKDVTIKQAPRVEHGSRSRALYAIWNAMADLQGYRPYSRRLRTAETIVHRGGRPHGQDDLFDEGYVPGTWRQAAPASSTAKATTGHYDWSQHPQSASYAGNGNVSMDAALEILDEMVDEGGIVMDDVAEQAAIEETAIEEETGLTAEQAAKIDELTEYALAHFEGAGGWDEDTWQTYYVQNLEHEEFVKSVVSTPAGLALPAVDTVAATPDADAEARADWESLQAREAERRGPAGKPATARTAAAPVKAAVKPAGKPTSTGVTLPTTKARRRAAVKK